MGLKHLPAASLASRAHDKFLALLLQSDLLVGSEVLLDLGPFQPMPRLLQAPVQLLAQHQGQKLQNTCPRIVSSR